MANLFGWAMTFERIPQMIAEWMTTVTTNPLVFLLLINVFLIILGMFIEGIALIIILTPIFVPILPVFGIDPSSLRSNYLFKRYDWNLDSSGWVWIIPSYFDR